MDSQLIQRTRYQLQARVRATKTCPNVLFFMTCGHLLEWIDSHPFVRSLLASQSEGSRSYSEKIEVAFSKIGTPEFKQIVGPWVTATRDDAAAVAEAALRALRRLDFDKDGMRAYLVAFLAAGYNPRGQYKIDEVIEALRDVCVATLYDHLDESIDSRNAVLGLLVKYKHRSEMYRRHRLIEAATVGVEGRTKERALAFDFYEYLHDQGVDFWIESVSASGEPDLISRDASGERLVADAKYVDDPSKARRAVVAGFRQVLDYCRDHNEPVGYLVVFVSCDMVLDLKAERDDGFPCFRTGGYTVYYVVIDIHAHSETASKRPKPPVFELAHADLVSALAAEIDVAG